MLRLKIICTCHYPTLNSSNFTLFSVFVKLVLAVEAARRFVANILSIPLVYSVGEEGNVWSIMEEFGNLIARFNVVAIIVVYFHRLTVRIYLELDRRKTVTLR